MNFQATSLSTGEIERRINIVNEIYSIKLLLSVLYGCGFKKLGLGQTPAPLVGTKSQLLPKKLLKASLMRMWILFPPMLVLLFRGPKSWQHLGAGKRDVQ